MNDASNPTPSGDREDQADAPDADRLEGEGSYTAARRHRESAEAFVREGRVAPAAREAAPKGPSEAESLLEAEARGRSHAKG